MRCVFPDNTKISGIKVLYAVTDKAGPVTGSDQNDLRLWMKMPGRGEMFLLKNPHMKGVLRRMNNFLKSGLHLTKEVLTKIQTSYIRYKHL